MEEVYLMAKRMFVLPALVMAAAVFLPGCAAGNYAVTVEVEPAGVAHITGEGTYDHGEEATITVESIAEGYEFIRWTEEGQEVSTERNYRFAVKQERTLVAEFQLQEFSVVVSSEDDAKGKVSGGGIYCYGDLVSIEVEPEEGYVFVGLVYDEGEIIPQFELKGDWAKDWEITALFDDAGEAQFERFFTPVYAGLRNPQLSPDRQYLLGLRGDQFFLYQFPEGALIDTFTVDGASGTAGFGSRPQPGSYYISDFAWLPRSEAFVYYLRSAEEGHVYKMNLDGQTQMIFTLGDREYSAGWVEWSPEHEIFACYSDSGEKGSVQIVNLEGELLMEEELELGQHYGAGSPLFSPDGRRLAFSFEESLWVLNLDNAAARQFEDLNGSNRPFLWVNSTTLMIGRSPDSWEPTELSIIDLETGSRRFVDHQPDLQVFSVYDHSRLMGVLPAEGQICRLDLNSGQQEMLLEGYSLAQVRWENGERALLSLGDLEGHYIFMWPGEGRPTLLVESERLLRILGVHDGYLHYLQSNERGTHWSWEKQIFDHVW